MSSLVRPKRVTIKGSDGNLYSFLCKPKDDLRKDARLMDLFSMINKMLKANSESRRRQLREFPSFCPVLFGAHDLRIRNAYLTPMRADIKTYAVMPLSEKAGLIEWVPGVMPMRLILQKLYEAKHLGLYVRSSLDECRLLTRLDLTLSPKPPRVQETLETARKAGPEACEIAFVTKILTVYVVS